MFHLFHPHYLILLQDFDGIESLIVFRLDQLYSTEATCSQGPQQLKIIQGVFALCLPDLVLRHMLMVLTILLRWATISRSQTTVACHRRLNCVCGTFVLRWVDEIVDGGEVWLSRVYG